METYKIHKPNKGETYQQFAKVIRGLHEAVQRNLSDDGRDRVEVVDFRILEKTGSMVKKDDAQEVAVLSKRYIKKGPYNYEYASHIWFPSKPEKLWWGEYALTLETHSESEQRDFESRVSSTWTK